MSNKTMNEQNKELGTMHIEDCEDVIFEGVFSDGDGGAVVIRNVKRLVVKNNRVNKTFPEPPVKEKT